MNDEETEDYFVGVEKKKSRVVLDNPIYTGFTFVRTVETPHVQLPLWSDDVKVWS